jgi:hypothetical protein
MKREGIRAVTVPCGDGSELALSEVEGTRPGRARLGRVFAAGKADFVRGEPSRALLGLDGSETRPYTDRLTRGE